MKRLPDFIQSLNKVIALYGQSIDQPWNMAVREDLDRQYHDLIARAAALDSPDFRVPTPPNPLVAWDEFRVWLSEVYGRLERTQAEGNAKLDAVGLARAKVVDEPTETNKQPVPVNDHAYLASADLAKEFGLKCDDAFESRLRRLRRDHDHCYKEDGNRRRNEPTYFYQVGIVRPYLEEYAKKRTQKQDRKRQPRISHTSP